MQASVYEKHDMRSSPLPFVFHTITRPRNPFPSHWHEELEILYCISGNGTVRCGETQHQMEAGDILVINSDCIHYFNAPSEMVYYCLILDRNFCESNALPLQKLYFQELVRDPELEKAYLAVFQARNIHIQQPAIHTAAAVRAKVLELLCLLCQNYLVQEHLSVASLSTQRIKNTILYIRQNYTQDLSLEDIAQHIGVSKYYLSREFKRHTGKTVFEILVQIRCMEAMQLIRSGTAVSAAALSCGFVSLSYFTRTFKKQYGANPSHFLPK